MPAIGENLIISDSWFKSSNRVDCRWIDSEGRMHALGDLIAGWDDFPFLCTG